MAPPGQMRLLIARTHIQQSNGKLSKVILVLTTTSTPGFQRHAF
jgi:hypothetical protein